MEQRRGTIILHPSGGTAGKGGHTCKLTLPSAWMKEMGISELDREVELSFDGKTITVTRPLSTEGFLSEKRELGHKLLKLSYFDGEALCTTIAVDMTQQVLHAENHTDHLIKTAFGNNRKPTWEDLQQFLARRCVPKTRAGLREYLEAIGVEEYDPMEIIQKTQGRMAEDGQWLRVEVLT